MVLVVETEGGGTRDPDPVKWEEAGLGCLDGVEVTMVRE